MANSLKKRGQKLVKKFSRTSLKVSEEGKEHIKENLFQRFSHIQNIRLLIFEWSLLVVALIMLGVAQAFWLSDSYAENTFVNGGTYIEATVGRVNSMNPLFAATSSEKTLSRLMFATLVSNDYSGHPGLGLADKIRSSEDGKVWTIRLRDNLKWSDGEALTNEDVMFTLGLIQSPVVSTVYDANLANVKIEENANGEIVFTLASAYADFKSALEIPIVPKHELMDAEPKTLVEDSFSIAPVTSGAFMFNATQVASSSDDSLTYLSANPYYYGGRPMLSSFGVHAYADREAVIAALNAGAVTATAELTMSDAERITAGNVVKMQTPVDAGAFMFFNTGSGALKNAALRRAIRQGINVESLRLAAEALNAIDYPILDSQIKLASYPEIPAENFEAATTKIAEIKGGEQLGLNIVTINSGRLPAVAEELKKQLEALGINAGVMIYEETQEFVANVISKRAYDILIYEVELGADPDLLPYYHSSQATGAGLNLSNYRNTLVDDLLIGARETLDVTLRAKKYESFLEYWVEDVPAIGLYQANMTYMYNKNARCYNSESIHLVTALDRFIDVTAWATNRGTKNLTP